MLLNIYISFPFAMQPNQKKSLDWMCVSVTFKNIPTDDQPSVSSATVHLLNLSTGSSTGAASLPGCNNTDLMSICRVANSNRNLCCTNFVGPLPLSFASVFFSLFFFLCSLIDIVTVPVHLESKSPDCTLLICCLK